MGEMEVSIKTSSLPLNFVINKKTTGQELVNRAAGLLGLREMRFFGLQFVDYKGTSTWLEPNETVSCQRVRKESTLHFELRVRYWPRDVMSQVSGETALVLFFRQLQADIDSGEMCCPSSTAAQLAAYAAQVQYGDFVDSQKTRYRDSFVPPGTASSQANQFALSPEAEAAWQMKVACLHRKIRGLSQRHALNKYFKLAQELPTYGVAYFTVINRPGAQLWLGVSSRGVNMYEDKLTPKVSIPWSSMSDMYSNGHKITIKLERKDSKFVLYTSRKQICMNIMLLIRGYVALRRLQRRSNHMPPSHANQEPFPLRPGQQSSDNVGSNESTSSKPSSAATSSGVSSRPTSFEDDGQSLSATEAVGESEGVLDVDARGLAAEESDTPATRDAERETVEENGEASAVGSNDTVDSRGQATAAAQGSDDDDNPQPPSGADEDTEADGSDAESSNGETVEFHVSSDEECDSYATNIVNQSTRSRFEATLSLSASENWGPFAQSLMAPD